MVPSVPSTIRQYRGRFAPSPSGPLHFGSLVAAVGSWLFARQAGGDWLVRIEDIDPLRERPGASQAILDCLAAFGLVSDGPVLFQSTRRDHYRAVRDQLAARGLAYRCGCSRQQLQAFGGIHPPACPVPPADDTPCSWRLRVGDTGPIRFDDQVVGPQAQDVGREVGDFVIWRVDDWPAYQLAVVVDDADQGITDIIRGADLLDSTPRQILLQQRLGLPTPRYGHLPLAVDAEGRKLSKSDAARPVDPAAPMPALHAALQFLGQPPQVSATRVDTLLANALAQFAPSRIPVTNTRLIGPGDGRSG